MTTGSPRDNESGREHQHGKLSCALDLLKQPPAALGSHIHLLRDRFCAGTKSATHAGQPTRARRDADGKRGHVSVTDVNLW